LIEKNILKGIINKLVYILEIKKIDNFDENWNKNFTFSAIVLDQIWGSIENDRENADKNEQSKNTKQI
jgi:hypothetical protein